MKRLYILLILFIGLFVFTVNTRAQIYEPEGLNMPGDWDGWNNPPTNLVLANPNQTTGGLLVRQNNAVTRWFTTFEVAASGGDFVGGTYTWIFTSGTTADYYLNKWSSVAVTPDQLQLYTKEGADDNTITLENGYWYTMVWEDIGYVDTRAIFMKTSEEPVEITSVTEPSGVNANEAVDVDFTISGTPCAEENFYLQYTNDGWTSASVVAASLTGTNGSATIPGQAESSVVEYNIFSSSVANVTSDGFLHAMRINDNNESNYTYTVGTALPDTIGWCNLQWPPDGEITPGGEFTVYGRVFIYNVTDETNPVTGLEAWVGWSDTDSDPSTWTNWVSAPYFGNAGDADEYAVDLGAEILTEGTYYYATRFKYLNQDYEYGGYSENTPDVGDFWDGADNVSGVLEVTTNPNPDEITWCNLQWPPNGEIEPQGEFFVYGQVYIEGVTNDNSPVPDLNAWIGVSSTDSDPSSWSIWYPMDFSANIDNNDEYIIDLGEEMLTEGTFYYATRFQYQDQGFVYGGYSENAGGFWNGTDYVSGVLTVNENPVGDTIGWANLQWPPVGEILPNEEFTVFGQAFIDGVTSQFDSLTDLQAWIGYSDANTDPATWTNWIPAWYLQEDGNNDEYSGDLGGMMGTLGTYYYATRFKYEDQEFVYGGYSEAGGGFWDGVDNVNGMLTVTENPAPDTINWCNLQWPPNGTIEPNAEFLVYGQTWIDGITGQPDSLVDLNAWVGYHSANTDPSTWTNWIPAWYSYNDGDNDEYLADLGAVMDNEGVFYYATRFQYLDQEYVYGGYSDNGGGFWDGVDNVNGMLNVQTGATTYPVLFTVTDVTGLYNNIKFKGDMTGWNPVDMQQDGADWSVTMDIAPGTYEWGVFEDDGSPDGIWLIIGDNLVMSVDDLGNVTGETTYTITFVGLDEMADELDIYPNPVNDQLWINSRSGDNLNIRLLDASGKLIREFKSSEEQILLDMQQLTKGLYFLEISDSQRQFRTKVIKQ